MSDSFEMLEPDYFTTGAVGAPGQRVFYMQARQARQVVTLKVVKTAGPLMQSLEKKLDEVSDKLSKATIDLVAEQEKLMVAKIKFQDGVAELSLEPKKDAKPEEKPAEKAAPKKV